MPNAVAAAWAYNSGVSRWLAACNCPKIVRRLFESDDRIAARLTLAEQYERSE